MHGSLLQAFGCFSCFHLGCLSWRNVRNAAALLVLCSVRILCLPRDRAAIPVQTWGSIGKCWQEMVGEAESDFVEHH